MPEGEFVGCLIERLGRAYASGPAVLAEDLLLSGDVKIDSVGALERIV